jgi:hypothetical protein
MKTIILLTVQMLTLAGAAFSQQGDKQFGVEANQFLLQSGFGTSTELQIYILDNNGRRLSIGTYFDSKLNNIGGVSVSFYKVLGKNKKFNNRVVEPYVFYNFIFHKTIIDQPRVAKEYNVATGKYKSMEHHAGLGLKININKNFYFKGEAGYGVYFGSIMKPSSPHPILKESHGTNGTGALLEIGTGILF